MDVLQGASLEHRGGELVGLVEENGSGGAIQMALMEENGGAYRPAVKLATSIIESQSAELKELNALTRALGD